MTHIECGESPIVKLFVVPQNRAIEDSIPHYKPYNSLIKLDKLFHV